MDLHSNDTYWPIKNGRPYTFSKLNKNEKTEIAILGGGITGALVAESFTKQGIGTIVIDKRIVGHGSTSASTALLQYEIDEPLYSLREMIGKEHADKAYKLCSESIDYISDLVKVLDNNCGFVKRPSLLFSLNKEDTEWLRKEYYARKDVGFSVNWLDKSDIKAKYNFTAEGAIHSEIGAQIDPYSFTYKLLELVERRGGKVIEETEIVSIKNTSNKVILTANNGFTVEANKIVFATGYETKKYLKEKTANLKSTYACISKPINEELLWNQKCLLWNTENPYFYSRITTDNRIMIGGEDTVFTNEFIRDWLVPIKTAVLKSKFKKLFPHIPFEVDYAWTGTFGETKDGLPYIGESREWENAYFALGYGGNGITFSAIAAQALPDLYKGKSVPYLDIFRFGR